MIDGKSKLVGLLGKPVDHSLSPVIQNAALEELGLNWCYLALECEKNDLSNILNILKKINCKGLNITIPHKESVINFCSELSPIAQSLGAVNTLIPNKKGGWYGDNTDLNGFLEPLKERNWNGDNAIVLGCGGSARAVVAGLQIMRTKQINIVGRNSERLNQFIKTQKIDANSSSCINGLFYKDKKLNELIQQASLIINTTPVGMNRINKSQSYSDDTLPFGEEAWRKLGSNCILYDLIYIPRPTSWLQMGAELGCQTIDGLEMLIQQGAASLKLWSGKNNVPINVMRKAAEQYLSKYCKPN